MTDRLAHMRGMAGVSNVGWRPTTLEDADVPCDGCGRCDCGPCLTCGETSHADCKCEEFDCVGLDNAYVNPYDTWRPVLCVSCYGKRSQ